MRLRGMSPKRLLAYSLLTIVSLLAIGPYLWAVMGSLLVRGSPMNPSDLIRISNYGFDNYLALAGSNISLGFLNSLLISSLGASLSVLISFLAAYALASPLARREEGGLRRAFISLIMLSLMFPAETKVLINFVIMRNLHLVDTYSGIYLPSVANLFTFLLFYQALLSYPVELEEAATLEGMSPLEVALNIVLPSLRGVTTTAWVFNFVALWNDFLWPLVVLPTNTSKQPLQVMIAELVTSLSTNFGHVLAATVLASLPVLLIFLLLRESFTSFELS